MQNRLLALFLIGLINGAHSFVEEPRNCTKPLWFQCADQEQCIAHYFVCDGETDCRDGSDEKNCKAKPIKPIECKSNEYQCKDRVHCIDLDEYCNGQKDCMDGSDEPPNCKAKASCKEFKCTNGKCVPVKWMCDGNDDCGDKSDEHDCDKLPTPPKDCNNTVGKYLCNNKDCVAISLVCNGHDDCGDGSDEYPVECAKAKTACNETVHCQKTCTPTPRGAQCSCSQGFFLHENGTCTDINECLQFNGCSQICRNTEGSYSCECEFGYELGSDGQTCKAQTGEALLVYASQSSIRGYYLDSQVYYPIAEDLRHVVGVSLDANYVYWTDIQVGDETIFRSLEDGSKREVIVTAGLGCPEELAIDWITGNIYFTDSMYKHIGVCNKNGDYCTIVIKENTEKPRGLALLPSEGKMYWSDWGAKPHISVAFMDGSNRTIFIKDNLGWPNGLTIDYPSKRLYWVDAKLKVIESIFLDGRDRRTVLHDVAKHPYSISIFEDKLYWSDWSTNAIHSCNKFTGKNYTTLFQKNETVYGIHIYHSTLKVKFGHPCATKPCSQLCLPAANRTYTCACTMDKELNDDKRTCKDSQKRKHLAIAAGSTIIDYYHELLGRPRMSSSVTADRITAMTYDSIASSIIAADETSKSIFRFDTHTSEFHHIIPTVDELIECIAFDYFGNNLYKSDTLHKKIDIHSLTTGEKTELSFTSSPYDLVVVPEEGLMFVVFRTNNDYHIDKAQMNGLGSRSHLIEYGLLGPRVSLAYDLEAKRLYWSDEGTGRIESVDNNGQNRLMFRTGLSGPVSIAIMDNQIFWTTRKSNRLSWGDKSQLGVTVYGNKGVNLQIASTGDINRLQTITGPYTGPDHPCRKNNGDCSHICLVTNSTQKLCACPIDYIIHPDQKTCRTKTSCLADEFKCSNDKCIKNIQRCNGVKDCSNGEDEKDCVLGPSTCHPDEFACRSGECIEKAKHCNSVYDCKDHSDEEDCENVCKEFRCRDGSCVPKLAVCNGRIDCHDLSDEDNCSNNNQTCEWADSFKCLAGGCIPGYWECDGQIDCSDGSDEHEHCHSSECGDKMFLCKDGGCVDESFICNGHNECRDGSDEEDCPPEDKIEALICPKEYYRCHNSTTCILPHLKCNARDDCPLSDDERDCHCLRTEFKCNNGKCIPKDWQCDHVDDCGDESDESKCDMKKPERPPGASPHGNCSLDEFACASAKTCLPLYKACDGENDCLDGSDEGGQCNSACTENPCENMCHKTPLGPVCTCRSGYNLGSDGKSCEDDNECLRNVCSQNCTNLVGSYMCSCFDGFALKLDRISCKPKGASVKIIMSTDKKDITIMSPNIPHIPHKVLYDTTLEEINGLDVNVRKNSIYYSDDYSGMIFKMDLSQPKNISFITSAIGKPEVLAIDWISDNIYFFDNGDRPQIKICVFDSDKCASLLYIDQPRDKITSIAVAPLKEILFWAQIKVENFKKHPGKIMRSDLSGEGVSTIISDKIGMVSGLTVDHYRSIIYWADHTNSLIESANFFGDNRKIIKKYLTDPPIGLNLYEDSLFWKAERSKSIKKLQLYGDMILSTIPANVDKFFVISQLSRQPDTPNKCKNISCDHVCVVRAGYPGCFCENNLKPLNHYNCSDDLNKDFSSIISADDDSGEMYSEQRTAPDTNVGSSNSDSSSGGSFPIFPAILIVVIFGSMIFIKIKRPDLVHRIAQDYCPSRIPSMPNIRANIPFWNRSSENGVMHEYANPINNQQEFNPLSRISADAEAFETDDDGARLINR